MSFPSGLLVWAVVLAALLHEAIALSLFLVVLGVTGNLSLSGIWILIIAVPLQIALTAGLGFLAAAINVFFRDTAQINSMLLQGWFYLTPIVYPLSLVPERFGKYLALNPLTPLVNLYREALLGGVMPPFASLVPRVVATVVALRVGISVLHRLKPVFADEI
jgi:lipopolysaccharide transport system permease protein